MDLTGNLTNTQSLSQKQVKSAIANVQAYLSKDDPRLGEIEGFYIADKIRKETAELKNAYERRDVLVEPLFAEQGKAENAYNACGGTYAGILKPISRTFNFLVLSILLMLAGQISMTYSFSHSVAYEGKFFTLSAILFLASVLIVSIILARAARLIADALDFERSFSFLIGAALFIASFLIFRVHTKKIFLIYLAIMVLLWLAVKVVTMIFAGNVKRNAQDLKKAAKQVALVNQQIQESYQRAMLDHFAKYGIQNPSIPAYTVKNSDGFYIRPEVKLRGNSLFSLVFALLLLAAMMIGASVFSNHIYAEGWENIVSLSSGGYHVVGLREDGTCIANGKNADGQCEVSDWEDVKQISAGRNFTAALFEDGTVKVAHADSERFAEVKRWRDIVQIDASNDHVLALRKDGTCLAAGSNSFGESEVGDWENVVIIRAVTDGKGSISIAVTENGELLATPMEGWEGIVSYLQDTTGSEEGQMKITSLHGNYGALIGLTDDYAPLSFGSNYYQQLSGAENWDFASLRQIYIGNFTVGLKPDGTAIYAGDTPKTAAQISTWRNVVSMSGSSSHLLGLKKDGTVYSAGNNENGQCNVAEWENIREVYAGDITSYGICKDGTVVCTGYGLGGLSYLSDKNPLELIAFWLSS